MADAKIWPALLLQSDAVLDPGQDEALAACLDDFAPTAIQDLRSLPLPPGGLWDPTFPPVPDPAPAPLHWRVFFATTADRENAQRAIGSLFPTLSAAAEDVPDEDWAARSQRELTAIRAGRFIVAPPWDVPRGGLGRSHELAAGAQPIVIVIEPSRGFGTGHHASTRLCLRLLSDVEVRGKRVVDLGTGSGVLAMAASISGARQVIAVDIDPDAIDSARESARLNPHAGQIHWLVGDFRHHGWDVLTGGVFDLVLANLTGGMLTSSAARIRELLARDGMLICSGFDQGEAARVEETLGLARLSYLTEEDWVGLGLALPSS